MAMSYKAILVAQITLLCCFILYHLGFIALGTSALVFDRFIREDECGKATHVWKYALLNTIFSGMTIITYAIFPGGGEGARARVLLITILHAAFITWAGLMFSKLPDCFGSDSSLRTNYDIMHIFILVCGWHNFFFFVVYVVHELYLGSTFQADLTLMPEVEKHAVDDFSYSEIAGHQHMGSPSVYGPSQTPLLGSPSVHGPSQNGMDTVLKVDENSASLEPTPQFIEGIEGQYLKENQVLRKNTSPRMRVSMSPELSPKLSPQQSNTPIRPL